MYYLVQILKSKSDCSFNFFIFLRSDKADGSSLTLLCVDFQTMKQQLTELLVIQESGLNSTVYIS